MPILVTRKFDENPIKIERVNLETPISHYKTMRICFFKRPRAPNSGSGPIWPKCELIRDFMPVLVTCKFDKDPINNESASVDTSFSLYSL